MFAQLNSSKRCVSMDAAPDAGPEYTAELLRGADVVLIDQWFLDSPYEDAVRALRTRFPAAVVVTVTPFGTSGPRAQCRGYDLTASAAGGISFGVGERDRAPLPLPFAQCDHQAGISAAIGALMAVLARGTVNAASADSIVPNSTRIPRSNQIEETPAKAAKANEPFRVTGRHGV